MNYCFLLFMFVFIYFQTFTTFGQNVIIAANAESKKPIAYAKVVFKNEAKSQLTDEEGKFFFTGKARAIMGCPGYHLRELQLSGKTDTVFLQPLENQLEGVVINSKLNENEIGYHKLRRSFLPTKRFPINQKSFASVFVENPRSKGKIYISTIIAKIKTKHNGEEAKIRIYLHKFNPETKNLKKALLGKNSVFTLGSGNGLKDFELEQKILLPENGVLVSFENLTPEKEVVLRYGVNKDNKQNVNYHILNKMLEPRIDGTRAFKLRFKKKYLGMVGLKVWETE